MASTTLLFNGFHGDFYSRRLLLHTQIQQSSNTAPPHPLNPSPPIEPILNDNNSFDANVVMVLSVLLCALICSLGLNSIIRCAVRCSRLVSNQSDTSNPSVRLANTGVKKKALKTFPTVTYSSDLNLPGLDTECAICLSEFCSGDKVRLLPKCNHGFHVKCIDKWLGSHSSCPTCRHCLIETCQKIVGCSSSNQGSSSDPSPPMEPVTLTPLEREGFIRSIAVTIPH